MTQHETIRQRLGRILAGQETGPKPITQVMGGGSDENKYPRLGWEDKTDPRVKVQRWIDRYKRGGPYADAIDAYPLYSLSKGWTLDCAEGKDGLKDKVQDWLDSPDVDLDTIMRDGILSAVLAGDAYQEIIPTVGGGIWGVVTRSPQSFRKVWDKYGRIIGYKQFVKVGLDASSDPGIPIEPGRIINLVLFRIPGEMYGASIWERADDDIQRDCDSTESIAKAIHRHGTPKQQWDLGSPEMPATKADLDGVKKEIESISAKNDFVTSNTRINMLDTAGIPNVDTYSNVSLQRTACAMGVPEEMLGLGRGSTEATATVRMAAFLKKISTIQSIVARTYNRNLIDRVSGEPGSVWISFPKMSPAEAAQLAAMIAPLRAGMDPDAIFPAEWCRDQFGVPLDDLKDEPEIPAIPVIPPEQQTLDVKKDEDVDIQ